MNWIKSRKQRIVIIISVAIILCSFPIIPLSRKADDYPHDIWTSLMFLMVMAGGGGIGAVIGLHIVSKRSKKEQNMRQGSHTNRLKKKAWKDFWSICIITIVALSFSGFMTYANARGVMYLLAGLCPVCVTVILAISGVYKEHVKQNPPPFDEREFHLIQRATHWGNNCFMAYVVFAMIAAFNLIGGRGMVPVWSIPLVLFSGLFIAGTVQFLVLMHYIKEDDE